MKARKVAVIAGDGIGPEVIAEGMKVLEKVSGRLAAKISFIPFQIGAAHWLKAKEAMPESVFKEIAACDAIYLGAVGDPRVPPGILEREILLRLRFELDLYINLRPCVLYPGAFTPLKGKTEKDIRFLVVRENSESVYTGIGGVFKRGTPDEVAVQEDVNTRKGVERCLRYAFDACRKRSGRKQLTLVDKANVLTHAHSLWRRAFEEVGADYPDVKRNAIYVDAAAMDFVRKPEAFDTVVTNNIFGDILTDLGAILSGGLGIAASANLNPDPKTPHPCRALFEPIHGSAPDIAGKGTANPIAAILAAKMMLDSFGETRAAEAIETAVRKVLASGRAFKKDSADLQIGTQDVGDLVAKEI